MREAVSTYATRAREKLRRTVSALRACRRTGQEC